MTITTYIIIDYHYHYHYYYRYRWRQIGSYSKITANNSSISTSVKWGCISIWHYSFIGELICSWARYAVCASSMVHLHKQAFRLVKIIKIWQYKVNKNTGIYRQYLLRKAYHISNFLYQQSFLKSSSVSTLSCNIYWYDPLPISNSQTVNTMP